MSIDYSFKIASQNIADTFEKLEQSFYHIGRLEAAYAKLERDKLTSTPKGGHKAADKIMDSLATVIQQEWRKPELNKALKEAEQYSPQLDKEGRAMLREMCKAHKMNNILTPELSLRWDAIERQGRQIHSEAKKNGDWALAKDWLTKVVDVKKQSGDLYARELGLDSCYDGLLAKYSPGFSGQEIKEHFEHFIPELKEIYESARETQRRARPLHGAFDAEKQMELNRRVVAAMGFDFDRGGLYATEYEPVEGGIPEDARAVIKYPKEDTFLESLKSSVHEAWHCIYTQNLPSKYRYTPLGGDLGNVKQESQALLGEMIIGRTPEFMEFVAKEAEQVFGRLFDPQQLYQLRTRVSMTPDRKSADEITYHLHIASRAAIEEALINDRINVDHLPEAWNEAYHYNLGIVPRNIKEGALQDVHWYVGKIGYFPSYTMGHAIAAQEAFVLENQFPDFKSNLKKGDFEPVIKFLTDKIYSKGRFFEVQDLLEEVTGETLKPKYQLAHLRQRYMGIAPDFSNEIENNKALSKNSPNPEIYN
jgi:carboxypeptidase Taq